MHNAQSLTQICLLCNFVEFFFFFFFVEMNSFGFGGNGGANSPRTLRPTMISVAPQQASADTVSSRGGDVESPDEVADSRQDSFAVPTAVLQEAGRIPSQSIQQAAPVDYPVATTYIPVVRVVEVEDGVPSYSGEVAVSDHHLVPVARPQLSVIASILNPAAPSLQHILPGDIITSLTDRQKRLIGVYRLSRRIRIFAVFDAVFIVIFGCLLPIFFILIIFPLLGYYGCRYWSHRLLYAYDLYLLAESIGGIISLYFIRQFPIVLGLRAVYVIINLYVFYACVKLTSYTLAFEESDFHFVTTHDVIRNLERGMLL